LLLAFELPLKRPSLLEYSTTMFSSAATSQSKPYRAFWWFLAVLFAVVGLVGLSAGTASAFKPTSTVSSSDHLPVVGPETRVGVTTNISGTSSARIETVSPACVGETHPGYDRIMSASCVATKPGTSGASNVANGPRLAGQLTAEEASSIFTNAGGLKQSVVNASTEIIPGTSLKNSQLIKNLTADGSNIADWGKYTTQTFKSPSGPFQVHFCRNSITGAVHYLDDYKVVFNGPR
jgi:hypothetical protein